MSPNLRRIALVTHSLVGGGAETLVRGLAVAFVRKGHSSQIILIDRPRGTAAETEGLELLKGAGVETRFLYRRPGRLGVRACMALRRLLIAERYDLIHSHLSYADAFVGLAIKVSRREVPQVFTLHSTNLISAYGLFKRAFIREAFPVACGSVVSRHAPDVGRELTVIPNGVSLGSVSYGALPVAGSTRSKLGIPNSALIVIAVGRLSREKNMMCAIQAARLIRDANPDLPLHLLICGVGEEEELCRREIISLGLEESVHLLGYRTDLHDLLQASDVFLSTSSWEGLPLTVLEAFAAGVPCVLSSIEEHREMSLGVEGAYLADADSPHSVAQQVLECARENWSKTQLVLSRREGLSRYSIDHCANQYLDLYESIIARREKQLSA